MSAEDTKAIATYLKSLPGSGATKPNPIGADDASVTLGRTVFLNNCAACHKASGEGVNAMVPAFINNPGILAPGANNVIRTILMGGRGAPTLSNPTSAEMPAFSWKLSDTEVAAVSNYIRNSWGNAAPALVAGDVAKLRSGLKAGAQTQTP
jgi:mono/diheme cytochrome c family protein